MHKYRDHTINLHNFILALMAVCALEMLFRWANFKYNNSYGVSHAFLTVTCIVIDVIRNTGSRVMTLLLGLGFGILIKSVTKYQTKILELCFVYMISQMAIESVTYINNFSPVSGSVAFVVTVPNVVLNTIFGLWIYMSLRRTLTYLAQKEQQYKFSIVSNIFLSLCVCTILVGLVMILQIFSMMSNTRDSTWKQQWIWEATWTLLFMSYLISVCFTLRPNEASDQLT